MRATACLALLILSAASVRAQSADATPNTTPKFELADVHASPLDPHHVYGGDPPRKGRWELRSATMLELINFAYQIDQDKIVGGPNWLEMDRFDVIAKIAANLPSIDTSPESGQFGLRPENRMLQSLLADRFKLVLKKEDRPFPAYVMTLGKKSLLKPAQESDAPGCRVLNNGPANPGDDLKISCKSMTMEKLAATVGQILGSEIGAIPVIDKTALKGNWNLDFTWKLPEQACPKCEQSVEDRASFLDTVDKQLGLKLEQQQVPIPVLIVVSADRSPTPNPPGVAEALPSVKLPTEFEVSVVKPTAPEFTGIRSGVQPGGRYVAEGLTMEALLRFTLGSSFGIVYNAQLEGIPDWAPSERFDITAKAPAGSELGMRDNTLLPMLRTLLEQRFGLKTHTEERPVAGYSLLAVKPKIKQADPATRSHCLNAAAPKGAAVGTVVLVCQNITMAQFADKYTRNFGTVFGGVFAWPPVVDATGLEGGWDFTLTYVQTPEALAAARSPNNQSQGDQPAADQRGGLTVTEAVEKQLGLKLELRKRPMPVTVIDHLERKPTDN